MTVAQESMRQREESHTYIHRMFNDCLWPKADELLSLIEDC